MPCAPRARPSRRSPLSSPVRRPPACHPRLLPLLAAPALLLLVLIGCSSPNRGVWKGSFDGSVSGVVELRINARGTKATGTIDGTTSDGQPFKAEMTGTLTGEVIQTRFEGRAVAGGGIVPIALFQGTMTGRLGGGDGAGGSGEGSWTAVLRGGQRLAGRWKLDHVSRE
jgi:hypothetical protein